ncbi:MAG: hypothetical protein ACE5IR_03125 [bacterium]
MRRETSNVRRPLPQHLLRGTFDISRFTFASAAAMKSFSRILSYCAVLLLVFRGALLVAETNDPAHVIVVSRETIKQAMLLQTGYDPTVTTNVGRFQAEVILELARNAQKGNPYGPPLLIRHDRWFGAFLEVNGLTEENAPKYAVLANQYRQDQLVDYHPNVIKKADDRFPENALNVQVIWPKTPELPDRYSFDDTLSTPKLKVTNHRMIRYRLLDFGDMIVYDEIRGLSGRPTSGLLGMLFKIVGEGRVVWSKISISADGLQIVRTHAKKGPFSITETVTVQPDGRGQKGLPEDRPDLIVLEHKLKKKMKINYHKWDTR